ncbi:hypothetical protein EZS27_023992 [termite gut metagenome]|uniref:Uncharacterized protein n=1 Tax=termite gut metagenome TaxID=433724 RepID=A0A5J4R1V4_9ZZZZ
MDFNLSPVILPYWFSELSVSSVKLLTPCVHVPLSYRSHRSSIIGLLRLPKSMICFGSRPSSSMISGIWENALTGFSFKMPNNSEDLMNVNRGRCICREIITVLYISATACMMSVFPEPYFPTSMIPFHISPEKRSSILRYRKSCLMSGSFFVVYHEGVSLPTFLQYDIGTPCKHLPVLIIRERKRKPQLPVLFSSI